MKAEIQALKLILNDYCEKVVPNLFRNSAGVSAKERNIVSYPTHIINAVFTAASIYAYEHLGSGSKNSIRDLKLLVSILTLHDIGKYFENKYGISGGNSKENIEKYFKTDDFKIKEFFPEICEINLDDIAWLVQNTELNDEAKTETIGHKTGFGRLADYSRLGDKIASLTKEEFYESKIFDALRHGGGREYVHVISIPKFPQFLIRRELLNALKKYYEEKEAIPFLLFENGLFYLHKDIISPEPDRIKDCLLANIKESMNLSENQDEEQQESLLSLRITNQSIDDVSVLHFPLPNDDKKRIILEQIIQKIPRAMKAVTIVLPTDKDVQKKLATIIYYLYKSKDLNGLGKLNDKIKLLKKDSIEDGGVGSQKYKIYAAKELLENPKHYEIDSVYKKCDTFLNQQLEKQSVSNIFDNIIKNISIDFKQTFEPDGTPKDKDEMCFLCGTKANTEYRAGKNYFLQAREFSKRGAVFDMQKKICSLCLVERNLIEGLFRKQGYRPSGDYLFAIFYFDKIFANVSYFSRAFSNVPLAPEAPITGNMRFRLGDFDGLYFVLPYRFGGKEDSTRQSNRVNVTKHILDYINGYGCKATLTSPYTLLRAYDRLFVNENPTRLEMSLGVQTIADFDELDKKKSFLDAIYEIDRRKGYFGVQSYDPFFFIHFIKLKKSNPDEWVKDKHINIVKKCFEGEIMNIEQVAQKGKVLYGNVWGASYKRTVLMRTALDAALVGLQQNFSDEELKMFVAAQIYKMAMREEYAKKKNADMYAKDFVDSLILYLKEKNWFSVHSLSSVEKYLVDAYEFALIFDIPRGLPRLG